MPEEKRDLRIQEANAVKDALEHPGVKILKREWDKVKARALGDLTNELIEDNTLKARQATYNQIVDWIDIPNQVIKKGEDAVAESKEPERKGNFIKRAVPFIGRRL